MASTMIADWETKKMTVVGPTPRWEAGADIVSKPGIRIRTATRKAARYHRAPRFVQGLLTDINAGQRTVTRTVSVTRIETLLNKVDDPVLADLWRQIRPSDVELPDRQGIIADLADFAEVLQPRLNGMRAPQLCSLIEAYATKHHRSQRFVRNLLWWGVTADQNGIVLDV